MSSLQDTLNSAQEKMTDLVRRLDSLSGVSDVDLEESSDDLEVDVREEDTLIEKDKVRQEEKSAASADPEQTETSGDLRRKIDQDFWKLCTDVLVNLVPESEEKELHFVPETTELLSFGYLGLKRQSFVPRQIHSIRNSSFGEEDHELIFFADALQDRFIRAKMFDQIDHMVSEGEKIDGSIKENHALRIRCIQELMQVLEEKIEDEDIRSRLKEEVKVWAKYVLPTLQMERLLKTRGLGTREERAQHIQLQTIYKKHYDEMVRLARSQRVDQHLVPLLENIVEEFSRSIRLDEEKAVNGEKVDQKRKDSESISHVDVRLALEEEVHYFRALSRLCARWARMAPCPVFLQERGISYPWEMQEIMRVVDEYDPKVFRNRLVKRMGVPPFLLLPATGNGAYDWKNNRLVVPLMHPRSILESVASAVIQYRIDVDRHVNDREMIRSFWDLKEMKKTRSVVKVQQRLMTEYVTWIVKESQGYRIMEKEIRNWFEQYIAPDKHDVKRPNEYRFLTLKEINEQIALLEADDDDSAAKLYRLGVLNSLKDKKDQGEQEIALGLVDQAIEMDGSNPDFHFTRGILCKRTRKKNKSRQAFQDFIRLSDQSWWSRKAQEHVSAI